MQLAARPDTLRDFATAARSQPDGSSRFAPARFQPSTWRLFRSDRIGLRVTGAVVGLWALVAVLLTLQQLTGLVAASGGLAPWVVLAVAAVLSLLLAPVVVLRLRWKRTFFRQAKEIEGIIRDLVAEDGGVMVDVRYQVGQERYSVRRLVNPEQSSGLSIGARTQILVDPRRAERAEIQRAYL